MCPASLARCYGGAVATFEMFGRKRRWLRSGFLALCALTWGMLVTGGCSEESRYRVLSVFFDGVPKPGEPSNQWEVVANRPRRTPRPKATAAPDLVMKLVPEKYPMGWLPALLKTVPHDSAGYPDMVAAFKDQKINPLPAPDDQAVPREVLDKDIKLIPKGKLKCIFSHQVHTALVECKSCHPGVFQEKTGEEIAMSDFDSGKFCGACHGKVAFPVKGECVRCHSGMKKKAAKEPPKEKLMQGEFTLARIDTGDPSLRDFPPATFPHLPHRVNFRCYACHDQIFPMKKGADKITMKDIADGKYCGNCHNGKVAFGVTFSTCARCHLGAS